MLSFIVSFLKKHRDQESGQSSLTQAQERQKGASPSKRHRGNCIGPAYTSCLQPSPKQTAKHFSGMDVRVINQGLRQQSRTLNTEATWEGAAQRDVLCCRTGGSPVRHGSLSRGGGGGRGSVGDEPLLAGKCYLKVRVIHTSRLMVEVIFLYQLCRERASQRDLWCDWVEKMACTWWWNVWGAFSPSVDFITWKPIGRIYDLAWELIMATSNPRALPRNMTPCEGKDISLWLLLFRLDELKRLICQLVSN